jgi:polar amino acid transport system substrate-binding protein
MMKNMIAMLVLDSILISASVAQTTLTLSSWGDPKDPALAPVARWATAAFKDAGYDLVLVYKPGERALLDANSGVNDGDLSRVKGIESTYANLVMVPEPLTFLHQSAYAVKKIEATSVDDLGRQGLLVAVLVGNKIMDNLVKPKIAPGKYSEVPDLESAFKMLNLGRFDVLLVSDMQAKTWLARPENASVRRLFDWLNLSTYTFLNKKWADAVPRISASYAKLRKLAP